MAHPDDAELWAGGALALHAAAGAQITIVVPRADEVRDREAAAGAEALGAQLHLPIIVDVTRTWEKKMRALAVHESQPIADHFAPMAEALGRLHGGRIGVHYAEAFSPVPILGRFPAIPHL